MGNGESRSEGLLLAIKNMEVMDSAYAGDNLIVSVFKAARYGGFGIIKGKIFRRGDLIARGEITVWHSDKNNGDKSGISGKV